MPSRSLQIWVYMAARFILRHRRKTIATASFIILGTGILVFLHALTVGINDTMVLNTTRLHYGDAFLELPAGFDHPESIIKSISAEKGVESALFRSRLSGLLTKNTVSAPAVLYAVNPESEAIEIPLILIGASHRKSKVQTILKEIGLSDKHRMFPQYLSAGEQQRVAVARAVIHSPKIVLADEPTANLDAKTGAEILILLQRLNRKLKRTILLSTHDPRIIENSENVLRLSDGKLQ